MNRRGDVILFVDTVLALGAFLGGNAPIVHDALITVATAGLVCLAGRLIWRWRR